MATKLNAQDTARAWVENSIRAKPKYIAGVQGVQGNPMAKAAAAVGKYADGCARAASDGSYTKGCLSVSEADWKQACVDKGTRNLDNGVRAAEAKMIRHLEQFLPFTAQLSARIQAMPKGSEEDAIERVRANIRAMKQYKETRRR